MQRTHVAAGILRNAGGQVLLTERIGDVPFRGLLEFSGGKIHADETARIPLKRERPEQPSIERKAAEAEISMPASGDFEAGRLDLPEELELVKKLSEFPDVALRAAETREPHHIAYYLREVAGLWNPYLQDGQRHRVISDDA